MEMLVDTREAKPLNFPVGGVVEKVTAMKLDVGDYQCRFRDGTIPPCSFERKGLGDCYGTMTSGYLRFKKEMKGAKEGAEPTLEGTPLMEAARKEEMKKRQPSLFEIVKSGKKEITQQELQNLPDVKSGKKTVEQMVEYLEGKGIRVKTND